MDILITFESTQDAMNIEKQAKDHQTKARLIAIPERISAGCGLALKTKEDHLADVRSWLAEQAIEDASIYQIRLEDGHPKYQAID